MEALEASSRAPTRWDSSTVRHWSAMMAGLPGGALAPRRFLRGVDGGVVAACLGDVKAEQNEAVLLVRVQSESPEKRSTGSRASKSHPSLIAAPRPIFCKRGTRTVRSSGPGESNLVTRQAKILADEAAVARLMAPFCHYHGSDPTWLLKVPMQLSKLSESSVKPFMT